MSPVRYFMEEAALPIAISVTVVVTSFAIGKWAAGEFIDFLVRRVGAL